MQANKKIQPFQIKLLQNSVTIKIRAESATEQNIETY
jgi:hypothetical protein